MVIGINASAAIRQPRTGVEEYAYQLIKHLTMLPEARAHRFLLYLPSVASAKAGLSIFDFSLPENFEIKQLNWPLPMWTQIRLASHMVFNKPDALFIPVHVLPRFHPQNSVVTIHGLEYEYFSEYYPFWFRSYLRWSTKYAAKHARKIIAVSENTKRDLVKLYGAKESDVEVIYHGIQNPNVKVQISNQVQNQKSKISMPYLLYIGRIELKKNILGILDAYKILKEKYQIPHELVLAGAAGFGYEKIKIMIHDSRFKIYELGYVSEEEKWQLLSSADIFLFPSFYEGFRGAGSGRACG
jgi:glycosyltransferase involved in cell wall biosynthesis